MNDKIITNKTSSFDRDTPKTYTNPFNSDIEVSKINPFNKSIENAFSDYKTHNLSDPKITIDELLMNNKQLYDQLEKSNLSIVELQVNNSK